MSKYLTANHTIQGGKMWEPQTNMGGSPNARFYCSPDRFEVTFDMVGMTTDITGNTVMQVTEAPSVDEFYNRIRRMLQMVTRGMAVMQAKETKLVFLTTARDSAKYQAQREKIAAACGMGKICDDCALSTRCPDLQ